MSLLPRRLTRRQFVVATAAAGASLALSSCAAPSENATARRPVHDLIRPTDPEISAREAERAFSGTESRHRLVAAEAMKSRGGLVQGYATEAGIAAVGPVLRASVGDRLIVDVENQLPSDTSVHWHGLRLRNDMDGAPPTTQPPIEPGTSFRYSFIAPDAGTHWYHSHSGLQADRALFGALIIEDPADATGADVDVVVVLDDWLAGRATPEEVLTALGGHSAGHGHGGAVIATPGLTETDPDAALSLVDRGPGQSELLGGPTQHIWYPEHLANGRRLDDPERIDVPTGSRVRIRLINAAAETPYRVALGGHRMSVIAADGFDTVARETDAVLIAPAQRVDVLVDLASGAWPLAARVEGMEGGALVVLRTTDAAVSSPTGAATLRIPELDREVVTDAELRPAEHAALEARAPDQHWNIELRQAGSGYAWAIAGADAGNLRPRIGERVRITMKNTSYMWHPMHLHGHTFAIREHGGLMRDTAIVMPRSEITIDFEADNPGQWMLHCHNAYHFEAGMTASLFYVR